MILYVTVRELFKSDICYVHSLDKGIYCDILCSKKLTNDDISKIKERMQEIINNDERIVRKVVTKKDAYNYYLKTNEVEKAGNILNLNNKTVTLYELHGYYNYFMNAMVDTTGEIKNFDLTYLGDNKLILSYPIKNKH